MFALGILVGLALFGAAVWWYRQPNSRFSTRLLGHDLGAPPSDLKEFLRNGPEETIRLLRALRTVSSDPDIEIDRQLMSRRFRILVGLLVVFGVLPLLLELIGQVTPVLVRGGLIGIAVLVVAISMLVHRSLGIARPVISYGNGNELMTGAIVVASAGIAAIAAVLLAILALGVR